MLNSKLKLVTLTGADDKTDLAQLRALSDRYPFVEWALLVGPLPGTQRNPSQAWP